MFVFQILLTALLKLVHIVIDLEHVRLWHVTKKLLHSSSSLPIISLLFMLREQAVVGYTWNDGTSAHVLHYSPPFFSLWACCSISHCTALQGLSIFRHETVIIVRVRRFLKLRKPKRQISFIFKNYYWIFTPQTICWTKTLSSRVNYFDGKWHQK